MGSTYIEENKTEYERRINKISLEYGLDTDSSTRLNSILWQCNFPPEAYIRKLAETALHYESPTEALKLIDNKLEKVPQDKRAEKIDALLQEEDLAKASCTPILRGLETRIAETFFGDGPKRISVHGKTGVDIKRSDRQYHGDQNLWYG